MQWNDSLIKPSDKLSWWLDFFPFIRVFSEEDCLYRLEKMYSRIERVPCNV